MKLGDLSPSAFGGLLAGVAVAAGAALATLEGAAFWWGLAGAAVVEGGLIALHLVGPRQGRASRAPRDVGPVPRYTREGTAALDEVNRHSDGGVDSFRTLTREDDRLVLMGSFDLDYYHDLELTFDGLLSSTCPDELRGLYVEDDGAWGEHRRYRLTDHEGRYEVVALGVSVEVGKVYHYDRGALLRPGERLAPWVKRA